MHMYGILTKMEQKKVVCKCPCVRPPRMLLPAPSMTPGIIKFGFGERQVTERELLGEHHQ